MSHNHSLIFVREFTDNHKVYWCRECGLIMESFGDTFAEMLPEWSRNRLLKEDRGKESYTFVKEKMPKQDKRLGKGLKDLLATSRPPTHLQKLLPKKP